MKILRMIIYGILCLLAFTLPLQVNAADETQIAQVWTVNTHGNTTAWLEGIKPILTRLKVLNPKQNVHIHESQLAGSNVGIINLVAEHPSMSHLEQVRLKADKDEEVSKLFAAMADIKADVVSVSLLRDRAPDQVKSSSSPVEVVYGIDTHGNNNAYVESSKKLHELIYKKIPDISVRIWEAAIAGQGTGRIYIIVGYKSMADVERIDASIEADEEIMKMFAERDKIGATIVSRSLSSTIYP